MSRFDDEVDVYERYSYLFKPATNLFSNFELNLAEILTQCDNAPNFVTAATILQGTSNIYARKVDVLHKMSQDFYFSFNKAPQKKKKEKGTNAEETRNVTERDNDDRLVIHTDDVTKKSRLDKTVVDPDFNVSQSRTRVAPLSQNELACYASQISVSACSLKDNGIIIRNVEDGLCIFETFYISNDAYVPCYLLKAREFVLLFHMPGNMMPLMDFEKRRLPLCGLYGRYAEVDDYKLIRDCVSYDNALTFEGSNLITNSNAVAERRQRESTGVYVLEMCRRFSEEHGIEFRPPRFSQFTRLEDDDFTLDSRPCIDAPLMDVPANDVSFGHPDASFPSLDGTCNVVGLDAPDVEERRSARLANRSNTVQERTAIEPDNEFRFLDIYADVSYKNKPFKVGKNIDVRSVDLQRKRDNFIKRKAEKENVTLVDSLQNFMQINFWRKAGKTRGDPVLYTMTNHYLQCLANCIRREKTRRIEIKLQLRKKQMMRTRASRRLDINRRSDAVDDVRNVTVTKLEEDIANYSMNAGDDSMINEDWEGPINVPSTMERNTPAPLGDYIPDHMGDIEITNQTRTRRQTAATNRTAITDYHHELDTPGPSISMSGMRDIDDALREMQGVEGATPESIANMVQMSLALQWQLVLKQQPVRHANYAIWENKLMPILAEMKDDFMADEYGKKILALFGGEVGKRITFFELGYANPMERARFLLAILMFVNRGTLAIDVKGIHGDAGNVENFEFSLLDGNLPDEFEIQLLEDAEWHGDALNQSGLFAQ